MIKKCVNVTLPLIVEEIENILAVEQNYYYRQAFAQTKLLQSLIIYVLNRVPISYQLIDQDQASCLNTNIYSLEERLHVEDIINQGIWMLLQPKHLSNQRVSENLESVIAGVNFK